MIIMILEAWIAYYITVRCTLRLNLIILSYKDYGALHLYDLMPGFAEIFLRFKRQRRAIFVVKSTKILICAAHRNIKLRKCFVL